MQAAVSAAIGRAVGHLVSSQDASGRWRDFPQVGGGSDEWVTGYVGAALAAVQAPAALSAALGAWRSLAARQRWSGGWGYMPSYPADADSTACALRLAEAVGAGSGLRGARARAFLARHQRADGGIATYLWPMRMRWHTRLRETFAGWCSPHVCVSANAAQLANFRGRRRLYAFLRHTQQADGWWRAYWWYDDKEYATAAAVTALAASGDRRDTAAVARALSWACDAARRSAVVVTAAEPAGSAFATALRARILALDRDNAVAAAALDAALAWLLAGQRADGGWASSAWLRFPPTETVDPARIGEWQLGQMVRAGVMQDGRGLFTTATVLGLLAAIARNAASHG